MPKRHTFVAEIKAGRGGGAYAEVPFDVEEAFGEKTPQVKAIMEGESFVTKLMRMGQPCHIIGVPKSLRARSGKDIGALIQITVEPDATPREVAVPDDLAALLAKDKTAQAFFASLSFTHRKEYVRWITEAKKEETRTRRLSKAMEMLNEGQRGI